MKISQSKPAAWGSLLLVVVIIVLTFGLRPVWWAFIDEFFMFMMVFCYLVSVYIVKLNQRAGKKLQVCALVCGVLMVLSLIGEYIAFQTLQ